MKILYIDCSMGAAGDMLTAALLGLFPDKEAVLNELNDLQIPGVEYRLSAVKKCGITGDKISVLVNGREEGVVSQGHGDHDHSDHGHSDHGHGSMSHAHDEDGHHHDHHDDHHHEHRGMKDIGDIVDPLKLPDKVKKDVLKVYGLIAGAESKVHGSPVNEIHFHEVGNMDAVADVTAVCYLINRLGVEKVFASPVNTGSGTVHCAHGILPVPAPATIELLKGVPVYSDGIKSELTTPTGAALLKYFVSSFGNMPGLRTESTGYGMGNKDFERANCVRVLLGESEGAGASDRSDGERVILLSCNIDDMTGEETAFAVEELLKNGAIDVFTSPIGMKKGRQGILLSLICSEGEEERFASLIFKYTTTIGIRKSVHERFVLKRRTEKVSTPYGDIRLKRSYGYGVTREKYEYEDIARIAREQGVSLRDSSGIRPQNDKEAAPSE